MIPRDSGMQCSGFVIPLMCRILNRGLGYGTTSGCTRRWPPQWKSSAQHWPMERPSAVTLLSISHRKPHFFYRTLHHTLSSSALLFSHLPKCEEKSTWLCVILLLVVGLVTTLFTDSSSLEHKSTNIGNSSSVENRTSLNHRTELFPCVAELTQYGDPDTEMATSPPAQRLEGTNFFPKREKNEVPITVSLRNDCNSQFAHTS